MIFSREPAKRSGVAARALPILLILMVAAGCARTAKPTQPAQQLPVTAGSLVALLEQRSAAVRTLKAQFSIQATGSAIKGTQRMEAALVYQRPNVIRLRTFARLGFPVFDLFM